MGRTSIRQLAIFVTVPCTLAAVDLVDLYVINISPYIVAGIAAGWLTRGGE